MKNSTKILLVILCIALIAAAVLIAAGTSKQKEAVSAEAKAFDFIVVDGAGNEESFHIISSRQKVGDALIDEGLIDGEEGPYGLYVKSVNGIVADYDTDGTYWAFYINGEMAMSGVDMTDIENGTAYSFKVEK